MPVSFGKIRTVKDQHECDVVRATALLRRKVRHMIKQGPFTNEVSGPTLKAQINHGRWLVLCPVAECAGAELVDPANPRFWCISCDNYGHSGKWYPVEFPSDRQQIESVLLRRSDEANQNWLPNETVEKLRQENRAHGIDR